VSTQRPRQEDEDVEQAPDHSERHGVRLADLAGDIPSLGVMGNGEVTVRGVRLNSREVRPGDLFVAVRGQNSDGNKYIREAIMRGAVAVLTDRADIAQTCPIPCLFVADARTSLAWAAASLYGHPGKRLGVVGVTGTDGKTTTAHLLHHLLNASGRKTGLLCTASIRVGDEVRANSSGFTTPEAPALQEFLRQAVDAGMGYAVVEASSHALALQRTTACHFDAGVFTNLTPEHLDFHGDLAGYLAAKATLFAGLGHGVDKGIPRVAVLNADDPATPNLREATTVRVATYGLDSKAEVTARRIVPLSGGTRFEMVTPQGVADIKLRLDGLFNVRNWLAAATAAMALGVSMDDVQAAAETAAPPQGRMQMIDCGQSFRVVVDFAHTPNALRQTLQTLGASTHGRLLVVFGHAGGRDRQNRPRMAEVAAQFSDFFVISNDDVYDEDPQQIADELAAGARAAGAVQGRDFAVMLDRRAAFATVFARARPGDTVLLAGRGHMSHTVVRGKKIPFDDALVARSLLEAMTERQAG
jgi:UDP-N-acetylmuramoyl-L-alanyl-D-glutamate--2,6-diaminopimelate ligase